MAAAWADDLSIGHVWPEPVSWIELATSAGTNLVNRLVKSPDEQYVVILGGGGSSQVGALVFDTTNSSRVAVLDDGAGNAPVTAVFSPDGTRLAISYDTSYQALIYDTATWTVAQTIDSAAITASGEFATSNFAPQSLTFTGDGAQLVIVTEGGTVTRAADSTVCPVVVYTLADASVSAPTLTGVDFSAITSREVVLVPSRNKAIVSCFWPGYTYPVAVFDYDTLAGTWTLDATVANALADAVDEQDGGGIAVQAQRYVWVPTMGGIWSGVPLYRVIDLETGEVFFDDALTAQNLDTAYHSIAHDTARNWLWLGTRSYVVVVDMVTREVVSQTYNPTIKATNLESSPQWSFSLYLEKYGRLWVSTRQLNRVYTVDLEWRLGLGGQAKAVIGDLTGTGLRIGGNATRNTTNSTAIGESAAVRYNSQGAIALGNATVDSYAPYALAVGEGAMADAPYAVAIGRDVTVTVPGGKRVNAIDYLPDTVTDPASNGAANATRRAASQQVVASDALNLGMSGATTSLDFPAGTLFFPEAVDVVGVVNAVFTASPSGRSAVNTSNSIAVQFSPDGSLLAMTHDAGTTTKYVMVQSTADWSQVADLATDGFVEAIAFSADGSLLAVTTTASHLYVFNTADWTQVVDITLMAGSQANALAFSPDGTMLAVGIYDPAITLYETSGWTLVAGTPTLASGDYVTAITFSPDGKQLAVGHSSSPRLTLYNVADWTKVTGVPSQEARVPSLAYSPDGQFLAVGVTSNPYLRAYEVVTWAKVYEESTVGANVVDLEFTADGATLFAVQSYNGALMLDATSWVELSGSRISGNFTSGSIAPNGTMVAAGGQYDPEKVMLVDSPDLPWPTLNIGTSSAAPDTLAAAHTVGPGSFRRGARSRIALEPGKGVAGLYATPAETVGLGAEVKLVFHGYVMEL
ncbi:WD40 domain-containing protein [Modicisalibacter luteus]|uniref:WD40 domain-containing protein n=1 Tax=Modicisalibacter luteus TaxID=453962 RepID=UPI003611D2B4